VDLQPEWVYELDSSHAGKFSRHLILRIPGMSFVNNWAVGHLVSQILAEPEVHSPPPPPQSPPPSLLSPDAGSFDGLVPSTQLSAGLY